MLGVETTDSRIRAVGDAGPSLRVDAEGWQPGTADHDVPSEAERAVGGTASALEFPRVAVGTGEVGRAAFAPGEIGGAVFAPGESRSFDAGVHCLRVEGPVRAFVVFEGTATLSPSAAGTTRLSFPEPRAMTLGFADRTDDPGTLTVPRSPDGVATLLSYAGANHLTATAERSRPDMRGRPPAVEFGEEVVPEALAGRRPDARVELLLPSRLETLFAAAPLATYLGASVSVESGVEPRLSLPGRTHAFGTESTFPSAVSALLRRVFVLDCLVRAGGPRGVDLEEGTLLDDLGLDPGSLYGRDVAERVAAYLETPFESVEAGLPDWHLSMYVEPSYDHVEALPELVAPLPFVLPPESEPLESEERLSRSLDDFYRAGRDVVGVEPTKPVLGPSHGHGWLADGVPIDVFKTVPEAYRDRPAVRAGRDRLSVVTVLNDREMAAEYTDTAAIYADHAAHAVDVSVRQQLDRRRLEAVFTEGHDLVHFIGHCDPEGLRCTDGNLAAADLPTSNTETFVLNACGSYHEGLELVRKGSVAGTVTFEKVLDGHAARVGRTFARLVVHGFSLDRALNLARRRIIMGKDYAVVGDGTHSLVHPTDDAPLAVGVEATDDGYRFRYDSSAPRAAGTWFVPPHDPEASPRLRGAEGSVVLAPDAARAALRAADVPVVYDGDIAWSDRVADRLDSSN